MNGGIKVAVVPWALKDFIYIVIGVHTSNETHWHVIERLTY